MYEWMNTSEVPSASSSFSGGNVQMSPDGFRADRRRSLQESDIWSWLSRRTFYVYSMCTDRVWWAKIRNKNMPWLCPIMQVIYSNLYSLFLGLLKTAFARPGLPCSLSPNLPALHPLYPLTLSLKEESPVPCLGSWSSSDMVSYVGLPAD